MSHGALSAPPAGGVVTLTALDGEGWRTRCGNRRSFKVRGRRNANHYAAVAKWERAAIEQPDPETFTRDILPMLHDIPLSKLANATGLTEGYCSFVRRGLKVPHRRHWAVLVRLADEYAS